MTEPIKLTIPSEAKYLSIVRGVLQRLLVCHEMPEEIIRKLVLCVDEACSNIIKYSYNGRKDCSIEFSFSLEEDNFCVKIRDYGKQCDTDAFKPRCLDDIKPGGLGTFFMHEIMDEVTYCTEREKGTLLTMNKNLKNELASVEEKSKG